MAPFFEIGEQTEEGEFWAPRSIHASEKEEESGYCGKADQGSALPLKPQRELGIWRKPFWDNWSSGERDATLTVKFNPTKQLSYSSVRT